MLRKLACLLAVSLSSCSLMIDPLENNIPPVERPGEAQLDSLYTDLAYALEPVRKPVIAVYAENFTDQTGQRRSNSTYATFSSALTQAPHAYLIRALKHAGSEKNGFFEVVERVSLESVSKERQLIRSTRENFDEDSKLPPLKFADMIMTGGVLSYQANTASGGLGARTLGIGLSRAYRSDSLTLSLRTVSVSTGKVLIEVLVTKTIMSASLDNDVFRFVSDNTQLVELEGGTVKNEPMSIALQMAIETAVLETIREGVKNNYWRLKE